jgi:ferrochelatase
MTDQIGKTAVILLAYGGPDDLEDIPEYLLDIRGGRPIPQPLIDEISERYRLIGGRSPLLPITQSVAQKLQRQLQMPVYVGMRHWQPYIEDVVAQIAADGFERLVAICMAPHYSALSIGKYRQKLEQAVVASSYPTMTVIFVESWGTQPDYLNGIAANVSSALERWPEDERDGVLIVFSAHSLPEYILEQGDPYDAQLRETAALLAQRLALPADRWTFSYQSAAKTGIPWLGPQIEDLVVDLAAQGERDLLVAPIGFIADHVEILYDIDIGVEAIAQEHGQRLERTEMLNDNQFLVDALVTMTHCALEPCVSLETDASTKVPYKNR